MAWLGGQEAPRSFQGVMLRDKPEFCNLCCWTMKTLEDGVSGGPTSSWTSAVLADATRTELWCPKCKGEKCLFSDIKNPDRKAPSLIYLLYHRCWQGWGKRGYPWQSVGLTPSFISIRTFPIQSCHLLARDFLEGLLDFELPRNSLLKLILEKGTRLCIFKTVSSTDFCLFVVLFCFETESHAPQPGLELTKYVAKES